MSIRDDLKAYLDGELSERRAAEVRAALEADPSLRKEADRLLAISRTLRTASLDVVPAGLEKTLEALKKATAAKRVSPWRIGGWVLAVGAAVTLMVAFFAPILGPAKTSSGNLALRERPYATLPSAEVTSSPKVPVAPRQLQEENGTKIKVREPDGSFIRANVKEARRMAATGHAAPSQVGGATRDVSAHPGTGGPGEPVVPAAPVVRSADAAAPAGGMADKVEASETRSSSIAPAALAAPRAKNMAAAAAPRLIVNSGDLGISVSDVKAAKGQTEGFARAAGGYVERSDLQGDKPENQTADLTVRVPVDSYARVLQQIKELGTVNRDASAVVDVTAQVVDDETRLKAMRAEEGQYSQITKKAARTDDAVHVKDKLSEVRQGIESLDAKGKSLRNRAAMSTISVRLSAKPK